MRVKRAGVWGLVLALAVASIVIACADSAPETESDESLGMLHQAASSNTCFNCGTWTPDGATQNPICGDYALNLQMCGGLNNLGPGVQIFGVSIGAATNCEGGFGSGVPAGGTCAANSLSADWQSVITNIQNCPMPPVCSAADGGTLTPPQWTDAAPANQGHTFNVVCMTPGPSSTCGSGQKECIMVDTTGGNCVIPQAPYCSGMNNPSLVFPGYGGTLPEAGCQFSQWNYGPALPGATPPQSLIDFYCPGGSFPWMGTPGGQPPVYLGPWAGGGSCNQPIPLPTVPDAGPGPLLYCNYDVNTWSGSYFQGCCACCQTAGAGGFSAYYNPLWFNSCSCTGSTASCP